MSRAGPRVLVLSRSYPNDVFPTLGLWLYAALVHVSALQRINRAFAMLRQADAKSVATGEARTMPG